MIALLASLVLLAAASVHSHPVTMQRGAVSRFGWTVSELASPSDRVHFHLALPQHNLDELDRLFWAVSKPDSDDYGHFLSVDEISSTRVTAAVRASVRHRAARAIRSGDCINQDYGDSVEVDTTVDVASRLFDATFHAFLHEQSGRRLVRASSDVSLSVELAQRVQAVYGLTGFPVPHLSTHTRRVGDDMLENDAIIPQSLYAMYGLPRNTTVDNSNSSGVTQGVIEWEGESFRPEDLLYYATNVSLNGAPVYPDEQIVGNFPQQEGGGESTLDVDMMVGVAPGNSNWFWLEDNQTTWLYGFTVHFLNASVVPDVISVSYGWYEGGQCDDGIGMAECAMLGNVTSADFVQRVNVQWKKIGLRGVSTFISSGDSGCHTRSDELCQAPTLLADYPSSSPYITSVGATQVQNDTFFQPTVAPACRARPEMNFSCISGGVEVAVDTVRAYFTSGGGFSNVSMSMGLSDGCG